MKFRGILLALLLALAGQSVAFADADVLTSLKNTVQELERKMMGMQKTIDMQNQKIGSLGGRSGEYGSSLSREDVQAVVKSELGGAEKWLKGTKVGAICACVMRA